MVEFEAGVVDRMLMWNITAMLYDIGGFWLTVTLPFVFSGALTAVGIALQVRDIRRLVRGQTPTTTYESVRWRGLLGAILVALAFVAAIFAFAFFVRER